MSAFTCLHLQKTCLHLHEQRQHGGRLHGDAYQQQMRARPANCRVPSREDFWYYSTATKDVLTLAQASGLSSNKEARRCLLAVAASLSSASPEEDSASHSSEGLGPKIDLNLPRRRLQLSFTCDACGARSQRLINPDAYARGTVFVQCEGCEVYHKLVDNLGLIEEYDFRKETDSQADGAA